VEVSDVRGADYSGSGPGSLIQANTLANMDSSIPLGTTSVRVIYRSTSGVDGSETEVSGAVFIPPGRPPDGGWPVVAFAHGTAGLDQECGPSLSSNLSGSAPQVASFVRSGFAVAATDYQGLGAPGAHPYMDAKTAGLNVIDSVRALRAVSSKVSANWAAFGGSQGGAAVWAANELASTYAPELPLLGTVSVVPAADLSDFAAAAAAQTLSDDQMALYMYLVEGIRRTRPGFDIDDYRRGIAKDKWTVLTACAGPPTVERAELLHNFPSATLVPATPDAQERLYALLTAMSLPQRPASAPMLVIYAGMDEYVPADATGRAIGRACALGDQIQVILQPDKGHGDVDSSASKNWLSERFAGYPAPSDC
jgi:Secretory lipase